MRDQQGVGEKIRALAGYDHGRRPTRMATNICPDPALNADQIATFQREGFIILERYVHGDVLVGLRAACAAEIERQDAEMAARGAAVEGINLHKRRYFIPHSHDRHVVLHEFVFSPAMAAVVRACLGDSAQLFLEQFVVKGCDAGSAFGWHQDSGYIDYPHREYLSCWLALDDVNEANGTIRVLPWSRIQGDPRSVSEHQRRDGTNDMIGYDGDDPGDPVIAPAGSLVVFSSRTFHRSTANTLDQLRRAWLIQYSAEPIMRPEGGLHIRAEPFLDHGRIVAAIPRD